MTSIFEIGTKVKYDATDLGGGFFSGIIHGYYVNGGELYYVIELDKKHQTTICLNGFTNKYDAQLFLSHIACHSGFVFEIEE